MFHITPHNMSLCLTSLLFPSAGASSTETAQGTLCTPTKRPRDSGTLGLFFLPAALRDLPHFERSLLTLPPFFFSLLASGSESEATPEKRPRTDEKEGGSEEARGTPKQKNRRRCYRCQTKLELVQQELGSCRCGQYRHMSVALSHIIKGWTNFHPHTTAFNFTDSLKCVSSNKICCSVLVLLWTTKTTETADINQIYQLLLLFLRLDECWCFTFKGTVRNLNH